MHSLAAARFPIAANTGRQVKVPECDAAYLPPPLSSVSGDEWTCGPRELFTSSLRHRSYDRHRPPLSYRHEPRKGRNAAAARTTLVIDGWGGGVRCAKVLTAITALPRRPLAERTGRVTTKCTYGRTIAGCERVSRRRRACVPPRSEERRWTEIGLKTEASRTVAGKDRGTTEREKRKTDRLRIRTGRGETVAAETGTDRTLLEPVMFGRSSGEQPIVAIAAPPVPPPPPPQLCWCETGYDDYGGRRANKWLAKRHSAQAPGPSRAPSVAGRRGRSPPPHVFALLHSEIRISMQARTRGCLQQRFFFFHRLKNVFPPSPLSPST